jgi:hypothetical protein
MKRQVLIIFYVLIRLCAAVPVGCRINQRLAQECVQALGTLNLRVRHASLCSSGNALLNDMNGDLSQTQIRGRMTVTSTSPASATATAGKFRRAGAAMFATRWVSQSVVQILAILQRG